MKTFKYLLICGILITSLLTLDNIKNIKLNIIANINQINNLYSEINSIKQEFKVFTEIIYINCQICSKSYPEKDNKVNSFTYDGFVFHVCDKCAKLLNNVSIPGKPYKPKNNGELTSW